MDKISGILSNITTVFFIGILVFVSSCKKDKTNYSEKVYDIIELNFDTTRIVSSIDTFINHLSGCGLIPSPSDFRDVDSLDLNNDLTMDSYISAASWYNAVSYSNPCVNYNYGIALISIQSDVQFMKIGMNNQVDTLKLNDIINSSKAWENDVALVTRVTSAPFSCNYQGVHYIGYRVAKGSGFQYGWLKVKSVNYGVSIIEGALNRTIDMGIPAGKKQ